MRYLLFLKSLWKCQHVVHVFYAFATCIIKNSDKNLVDGRGSFNVREEVSTLNFNIQSNSPYICKSCVGKLKKRRGIIDNLQKIESEISALHQSSKKREINKVSGTSDCEQSPAKRQATQEITLTSTPVKSCGYLTLCQPLCFSPSFPTPSTHRETVIQAKKTGNSCSSAS